MKMIQTVKLVAYYNYFYKKRRRNITFCVITLNC